MNLTPHLKFRETGQREMLSYETVKEADVTLVTAPTAHESRPPGIAGLQRHARRSDDGTSQRSPVP